MHHLKSQQELYFGLMMLWVLLMGLVGCASEGQFEVDQGGASTRRKPTLNHPRTWLKPYVGQPSAQCRRNTGGGNVPRIPHEARQEAGVVASVAIETAQSLTEYETPDEHFVRSELVSRQPHEEPDFLNNNLLAVYYFRCPQGGAMTQMFMWGVVYHDGFQAVQMIPWHNILNFSGTSLYQAAGHWWSDWHSIWCVPHDKLECWYKAYGHTRGRLRRGERTITIYLVRTDPVGAGLRAPKVYEFCEEIGLRPDWHRGASCIIDQVQVFPVAGM